MSMIYVSHKFGGHPANMERAKKITHDLQVNDPENCYICPLMAFSHLGYNEMGYDEEMALCIDLLSVSDVLIVGTNAAWLYYESQWGTVCQEVTQEADNGTNNFVGGDLIGETDN